MFWCVSYIKSLMLKESVWINPGIRQNLSKKTAVFPNSGIWSFTGPSSVALWCKGLTNLAFWWMQLLNVDTAHVNYTSANQIAHSQPVALIRLRCCPGVFSRTCCCSSEGSSSASSDLFPRGGSLRAGLSGSRGGRGWLASWLLGFERQKRWTKMRSESVWAVAGVGAGRNGCCCFWMNRSDESQK